MEAWTTIRYLQAQGLGIRAICREVGVSRKAVRHALRCEGPPRYVRPARPNPRLAPFAQQIETWVFQEHLIGSRIIRELEPLGYTGSASAVYAHLKRLRAPVPSTRATERFETPPGRQAQFDWSPYTVELGGSAERVLVYGLVLGYSRRKHYTASRDETQASIFEALEAGLRHFGGAPKEVLIDNPRAFVTDAHPAHFQWNAQFLQLCGHYRFQPRACLPRRAQTKGKIERPFFYLEQHFIKGHTWPSFAAFCDALAQFEADDLDVRVHSTTQERPLDRFQQEVQHLTPLPSEPFLGTLAETRKVSWDCLVSFRGSRYSVPAVYAGQQVWLLVSRGTHLLVLDGQRRIVAEHALTAGKGLTVLVSEHYAALRKTTARTYVVLAEQFLARFPHHRAFLDGVLRQHPSNPAHHLRPILALAELYAPDSLVRALDAGLQCGTFSHSFIRGVLEHEPPSQATIGAVPGDRSGALAAPTVAVHGDLSVYQRVLEAAR